MLNEETYENFWDVMGSVPSLDQPGKSVTQEILDFDHAHPTKDIGRLIDSEGLRVSGPKGYRHMQFTNKQRLLLTRLMTLPESRESELDDVSIRDWFAETPDFFTTNFWRMWETTFAFKDVSSAAELRRYMNRMILEFSRINTLEGVTRTPYNQYESVILPLRAHLQGQGVTFITNRKVTEFVFADTPLRDEIIVTGLKYEEVDNNDAEGLIEVRPEDLVFATNGSITDSTSIGDLDTAIVEDHRYAPSALLWKQAAGRFAVGVDEFHRHHLRSQPHQRDLPADPSAARKRAQHLRRLQPVDLPGGAPSAALPRPDPRAGSLLGICALSAPHGRFHRQTVHRDDGARDAAGDDRTPRTHRHHRAPDHGSCR